MAAKTSSFVTNIPLITTFKDLSVLAVRLEAGRQLYNAVLSEGKIRLQLVRNSELYQQARLINKNDKKAKSLAFQKAREAYRFSDYDLQAFANKTSIASIWIKSHLDANTIQKIATRAFKALERMAFGKAKKVRFKQKGQFSSLEGKTNKQGIRWTGNGVEWSKLKLPGIITNDPVILHGLSSKIKYVRLVRCILNQKTYWFAQLICEGEPYQKPKNIISDGTVGIDLGVSTVAIVGDKKTTWTSFAVELTSKQKKITKLQRQMDRQRRANNPNNFNSNGTVKKGSKRWNKSSRYKKTSVKKREIQRKQAAHRKSLHGNLVNQTLALGKHIKTEKVSVKAWQRNYGKSIGFKSPASFQSELIRKAESAGGTVLMFSTRKTALSQTCLCGNKQKKSLSQRVHNCSKCGLTMQRDILSAYLSRYVDPKTETLSIQSAGDGWLGMEQCLLDGWRNGSNQSARTATSLRSLIGNNESELMFSNPIPCEESEPERVNETHAVSWNPLPKGRG
ncbi:RNA-guided endonuclease TnpB family protein [Nostoc sp. 2RC]|uniref:RNA-guided endonuclease InsQ/TnpB family protein n=1 Tax=Nostoc sp. 2RC TaxID=2485484 RepID=UPI0016231F17|nr:RNA-guided endonuclease TnpB family protein [Nostoc sp. 2RC]MBC1240709.1 transposase [Nostoc sp. 2RC]